MKSTPSIPPISTGEHVFELNGEVWIVGIHEC